MLTHLPWTKWLPFHKRYIHKHFLEWKVLYFEWDFTEVCSFCSLGSNWQQPSIGLESGLAPNRRQANIWINVGPIHWHIYMVLGGDGSILNGCNVTLCACYCPASRTTLVATRFWVVMICPIIKCLTVLEFSFILFDLCLFITIFNFILNYVPIVTFWIFTYHKIWILLIIFCFIWSYWIIYFSTSLEVFWSVVS